VPSERLTGENPFGLLTDYELSNLAAHLISAQRADYLHKVLAMEVEGTRANAWFEVREKPGDADGYLNDVNRARDAAEAAPGIAVQAGRAAEAVGLEIHYTLVLASLSSRAERMPDNLRVALVDGKIWTGAQALADARRLRAASERAAAIAVLIPSLRSAVQDIAIAETLRLVEDNRLYWLVPILSSHLQTVDRERLTEESQRWLDELEWTTAQPVEPIDRSMSARINTIKSCVQDIAGKYEAAEEVLEPLAVASEEPASDAAITALLGAARSLSDFGRRDILGLLAPFLPLSLLPEALELAYLVNDAVGVLEACADLGPFLKDGVRHELCRDLEALPRSRLGTIALAKLAAVPSASRTEKLRALSDLLATDAVTGDDFEDIRRVTGLALLADVLDDQEGEAALAAAITSAREIRQKQFRAVALITIASAERARPSLSDQLIIEAYEAADSESGPPARRALALLKLVDQLRTPKHREMLSFVGEVLALPNTVGTEYPDSLASMARLAQVQLQAGLLECADVASRIAAVDDMIQAIDSLGRVGLFISAYVERPALLRSIAGLMVELPPKERASAMRATLHIIARLSRDEVTPGIVALGPVIAAVGGSEAVNAVVRSAQQVLAWWT
jgi:hypothetical protein